MRSLIRFILRHQNFFLFILLEGIAFIFLINHNAYQGAAFFNFSTRMSGNFHKQVSGVTHYFNLKEENKALFTENTKLKQLLHNNGVRDSISLKFKVDSIEQYTFIPAKIINITTSNRSNYAVIDVGLKDSIEAGMGVISADGVVGVIKATSKHYAVVMPIINHNYHVSSKLLNTNYFGSLSWEGTSYQQAKLEAIEKHVSIYKSDTIVTTGFGRTFPVGIPVGTISDFSSNPNDDFYSIKVDLAVNFKTVSDVQVISVKHKAELETLIEQETDD